MVSKKRIRAGIGGKGVIDQYATGVTTFMKSKSTTPVTVDEFNTMRDVFAVVAAGGNEVLRGRNIRQGIVIGIGLCMIPKIYNKLKTKKVEEDEA